MSNDRAIVLVTTSFPIQGDGSEAAGSFVSDLAEELARHVPVRVVAPGPESKRETWARGVELFRYASPARPLSTLKLWKPGDLLQAIRVMRAGLAATRRAVVAGPTGHLLALWGLPCGEWARRVAAQYKVRYSVWMLGSDVWVLGRLPILRGLLARVMQQAEHAYADGYQLAEDAQLIGGVPIGFLPSTRKIETTSPSPPLAAPPYRLCFLGRWHPNKGIDLLLDALAMLEDADWARIATIEIHGGGPMESLVRERVAALHAQGRPVVAGGYLPKADAESAIARADWLLIPSRIESIPVVFSDALKLGRPVIAMPTGDLPRLVVGEAPACAVLADSICAAAFCRAIKKALNTSPSKFADGVQRIAGHFNLRNIADRICREVRKND